MVVKPQNLLVIMSDEHNPKITGYAGHQCNTVRRPAPRRHSARRAGVSETAPECHPGLARQPGYRKILQVGRYRGQVILGSKRPEQARSWFLTLPSRPPAGEHIIFSSHPAPPEALGIGSRCRWQPADQHGSLT
jgi:hypothetical protein